MKKVFFSLLLILLVSCEARLDDNTRAFFKTRIVNASGDPLANASVEVATFRTFDFVPFGRTITKFTPAEEDFILGRGVTDANGEVAFNMLFDTNFKYFVNITSENGDFKTVTTGIESFNDNLTLDIPLITIQEISNIEVEFLNTSGTEEFFDVTIQYFGINCSEFFENGVFTVDEDCSFQSQLFRRINQEPEDGQFNFQAFFPSVLIISYSDQSGNDFVEEFTINNPTERYEINY